MAWKQRELLRIAARDLLGEAGFEETVAAISGAAASALDAAVALAGAERLAVVAMGKLGATELNYASDVDLVVVGRDAGADEVRAARRLLAVAGRVWPVDTALRPEGRDGALVRTLDGYTSHWDRWAEPWELQALLKARAGRGRPRPRRGAHAGRRRATLVRTVVGRRPADGAADEGSHRGDHRRVRGPRSGAQAGARWHPRHRVRHPAAAARARAARPGPAGAGHGPRARRAGRRGVRRRRRRRLAAHRLPLPASGRARPAARRRRPHARRAHRSARPPAPGPDARLPRPAARAGPRRPRPRARRVPGHGPQHPRAPLLPAAPRGVQRGRRAAPRRRRRGAARRLRVLRRRPHPAERSRSSPKGSPAPRS